MTHHTSTISPLRQRMLEDMKLRKLSPRTQAGYLRAVKKLSRYLGHSPATATAEELRQFQLHLVEHGISAHAGLGPLHLIFEQDLHKRSTLLHLVATTIHQGLVVETCILMGGGSKGIRINRRFE